MFEYDIENTFRSVGTRLSHYVYKKFGNQKLKDETINIKLKGSAGQSLGAFLTKGIKIIVEGDVIATIMLEKVYLVVPL